MNRRSEQGFTIIELVVVISLLGLLAAFALPKFVDLTNEAETASFNGIRGSFNAAVKLIHAQWLAQGRPVGPLTLEDGTSVEISGGGWPTIDVANAPQDTATELFTLIMSDGLPGNWTSAEAAAAGAGTGTYTLGASNFVYDATNGSVT